MHIKQKTVMITTVLSLIVLMLCNSSHSTSALTYQQSTNLEFTFNPTISVSVSGDLIIDKLTPGDSSDSNIIDVNVSTNNVSGYSLFATAGNTTNTTTDLKRSDNINNKFTSLATSDNLPSLTTDNTWGYSYSSDSGASWSNYSGLPLYTTTGTTLKENYNPSNDTINFKIAAKASNTQVSGDYTNTINFTATAFPSPITLEESYAYFNKTKVAVTNPNTGITEDYYTMQDMESGICSIADTESTMTVVDIRDNQTYTIAKLKDGKCWMSENLRITGLISAETSNFTSGDFNISVNSLTSGNSYTEPRSSYDGNVIYGAYYNYCAASAGTICNNSTQANADVDICPSNWSLPVKDEFQAIIDAYWSSWDATCAGFYNGGELMHRNLETYWWSATAESSAYQASLYYYSYNGSRRIINGTKSDGFSIRCLAR